MNTAERSERSITLQQLLEGVAVVPATIQAEITGVCLDSRLLRAGDVFFACKGSTHDGREYIDRVIDMGASAVIVEEEAEHESPSWYRNVPVVPVQALSCRLSKLAAKFYGFPAQSLWMVGITGTNGKTSVSQFVAQWHESLGQRAAVCGTLGYGLMGSRLQVSSSGPATTPDAVTLQGILSCVLSQGARVMSMEVSSHGLRQQRVSPADFDVAVFTNLSRDHLDYHGSMEAYGDAKRKLFSHTALKIAVVNLDDHYSAKVLNSLGRRVRSYTYSLTDPRASIRATRIDYEATGFVMQVTTPWGEGTLRCGLLGAFNASNMLAALAVTLASAAWRDQGVPDVPGIAALASTIRPVPGRMELLGNGPVNVVVDYAHTPDALTTALQAMRCHHQGRLWCVFGCGGDRDRGKRPLMARAAEALADCVVVTDDNPRHEASEEIIADIVTGFDRPEEVQIVPDRAQAIAYAIEQALPGDAILLAGKGHEDYQDRGGQRMVFSDVRQARLCLQARFSAEKADKGAQP